MRKTCSDELEFSDFARDDAAEEAEGERRRRRFFSFFALFVLLAVFLLLGLALPRTFAFLIETSFFFRTSAPVRKGKFQL